MPVMPKTKTAKPASAKATAAKERQPKKEAPIEVPINGAFAVVETGGKQYRVAVGDAIKIEKFKDKEYKEGDAIIFDKVLSVDNGSDATDIGTPYISGAKVSGTLVEIGTAAKVIVIKYKQKSRYFKKNGHRQPFFKVKIEKIA